MSGTSARSGRDWPLALRARLVKLWAEGLSGAEIASTLNREFGTALSKSAVVGKAHRMHLPARSAPIWHRPRVAAPTAPPALEIAGAASDPPALGANVRQAQESDYAARGLSRALCAWPIGHPRDADFHFCGARAVNGRPYCAEHCATAYLIVRPRPAEAA